MRRVIILFACITGIGYGSQLQNAGHRLQSSMVKDCQKPFKGAYCATTMDLLARLSQLTRRANARRSFNPIKTCAMLILELNLKAAFTPASTILIAGVGTTSTKTPGGDRNTGRLLAEKLVEMGANVACVTRTAESAQELKDAGIPVAGVGDLTDAQFSKDLLQKVNPIALFTAVGGKDSDGQRVDGDANINLFKAAAALEEKPFIVFVTSWGCGDTWDFLDDQTRTFLGPALRAKTEAEDFLRSTELRHVIVRPGGLMPGSEPATNHGIFVKDRPDVGGAIRRQDLANLLVDLPQRNDVDGLVLTALDSDMANADPPLKPEEIVEPAKASDSS